MQNKSVIVCSLWVITMLLLLLLIVWTITISIIFIVTTSIIVMCLQITSSYIFVKAICDVVRIVIIDINCTKQAHLISCCSGKYTTMYRMLTKLHGGKKSVCFLQHCKKCGEKIKKECKKISNILIFINYFLQK